MKKTKRASIIDVYKNGAKKNKKLTKALKKKQEMIKKYTSGQIIEKKKSKLDVMEEDFVFYGELFRNYTTEDLTRPDVQEDLLNASASMAESCVDLIKYIRKHNK